MDYFVQRHNFITPQPWELKLVASAGLSLDQTRFALAFLTAVLAGLFIRLLRGPTARNLYAALVGFLVVYYPFGSGVIHALPTALGTYLLMWFIPRKCGTLAWLLNFPYLLLLHTANASGVSWMAGDLDFTGGQMILTLKLISIAMCYQDHSSKRVEEMSAYQREHAVTALPSLLEYLGYVFCFGNLLGGPVIEFRDYQLFIRREGVWDPKGARREPLLGSLKQGLFAFAEAMISLAVYLIGVRYWAVETLFTPWYKAQSLPVRLVSETIIGSVYRARYFFCWCLGTSSCAFAGFDFSGWDAAGKPVWGRARNAYPLKVELCESSRMLAHYWNTTTGIFLRRYVYERLTPPGRKPTFMTLMTTQLVSGLWHGLYPGYIMFFAASAIFFAQSTVVYHWEAGMPAWFTSSLPWHITKIYLTRMCLDFAAMAFLLLTWRECIAAWASVYYIPLIYMVGVLVAGRFVRPGGRGKQRGSGSKASGGAGGAGTGLQAAVSEGIKDAYDVDGTDGGAAGGRQRQQGGAGAAPATAATNGLKSE